MTPELDLTQTEAIQLAALFGFELNAGDEDLARISSQAWAAIKTFNEPPTIFLHGGVIVRLNIDDAGVVDMTPMTADRMMHLLSKVATWYRVKRGVGLEKRSAYPPMTVARDLLANPRPPLPSLISIRQCPTFNADGVLHSTRGYNSASRNYYLPALGFRLNEVTTPSRESIAIAKRILLEPIEDFPFVSDADRSHALAAGFLPFIRDMIDGPSPLHLIEKPTPGTGGSLLADVVTYPATGQLLAAITEATNEGEWRKRITAVLRRSPTVVLIDNLNRELASTALAAVLTSTTWEDRLLGVSETIILANRSLWIATGNNPTVSQEIARRSIRIRLDAGTERPWIHRTFRKENLREWVKQNRSSLTWAYLTLCQAWIVAGRPSSRGLQKLGGFESWSEVLGGLLDFIQVPGFLGNLAEFYEEADTEGAIWRDVIAVWWNHYQEREVGVAEVFNLIRKCKLHVDLGPGNEDSQKPKLGKMLAGMRGRRFHGRQLVRGSKRHGAVQWQLVPDSTLADPHSTLTAATDRNEGVK